MATSQPTLIPSARWRRGLLSAFLLFNLIAVPVGSQIAAREGNPNVVERFLAGYVLALRVQQYWALFSPEPRRDALKYRAEIRFRDGHTIPWFRPYPPKWAFFRRHLAYNFQKWDLVGSALDNHTSLWDGLVHFLRVQFDEPGNPVTGIRWVRMRAPWPPPKEQGYVGGEESELVWHDEPVFDWDVTAGFR